MKRGPQCLESESPKKRKQAELRSGSPKKRAEGGNSTIIVDVGQRSLPMSLRPFKQKYETLRQGAYGRLTSDGSLLHMSFFTDISSSCFDRTTKGLGTYHLRGVDVSKKHPEATLQLVHGERMVIKSALVQNDSNFYFQVCNDKDEIMGVPHLGQVPTILCGVISKTTVSPANGGLPYVATKVVVFGDTPFKKMLHFSTSSVPFQVGDVVVMSNAYMRFKEGNKSIMMGATTLLFLDGPCWTEEMKTTANNFNPIDFENRYEAESIHDVLDVVQQNGGPEVSVVEVMAILDDFTNMSIVRDICATNGCLKSLNEAGVCPIGHQGGQKASFLVKASFKDKQEEKEDPVPIVIFDETATTLFNMQASAYAELGQDGKDALYYLHFDKKYKLEVLVKNPNSMYPLTSIKSMTLVQC